MRNAIHSIYKKTAEAVLPPLATSQFDEKRVLTPQEFVAAGDYLVRACPTWSWEAGDASKARSYLPPGKQYLVTRSVPCLSRVSDIERYDPKSEFVLAGDDDGWVATHQDPSSDKALGSKAEDDMPDLDEAAGTASSSSTRQQQPPPQQQQQGSQAAAAQGGDDDVPDITDLELVEPEDEAALPPAAAAAAGGGADGAGIKRTRTYDLMITYDQYYQVPRFWLVGFDEAKQPLHKEQVMEDVSAEHAHKTITLDPHPHLSVSAVSIHPCRHAEVMKKLADNLEAGGTPFKLEQYLVLFLKFIASVVPTIQYDYTMPVGGGSAA